MGKSKFQSLQVDDGQEVRLTLPEPYREGYWQISDDRGNTWKRLQVEQGAVLIFNATLDDNGLIYRAKVGRNLHSTPVKLRVQSCPKITQPPENIQTTEGSSVTFSVQATDTSGCPLSYQWQKNGRDIRRAHKSTLEIPFVTTFNVGTYTVIVSNEHCCTSASAELSLSIETPEQPQELQSLVINRGILRTSRPHHQTKKTVQIKEPTPSSSSSASNEYLNDLSERLLHSQLEITKAQTTPDKSAGQEEGPEKEWHDFVAQHNKESSTITVPISVPLDTVLEQQDLEEEDNLKESEHAVREALDKAFEEKKAEENALAKAKETSEHAIREALDKALAEEQALKEEALKEAEEKALKEAEEQALREEEAALKEAEARALQEEQEEAAYRLAEEEAFKRIEESLKREEEIARELEKAKLEQDLILAEARKLAEEREAAETKKAPQEVSDEKEVVSEETISEKEVVSEEKEESPEEKEDDEETTLEDESSTPAPVSKLVQA